MWAMLVQSDRGGLVRGSSGHITRLVLLAAMLLALMLDSERASDAQQPVANAGSASG